MSGTTEITVREHVPGADVSDFIRAGRVVFAGDPRWVPPLDFEIGERLHPKKNPFFLRAEGIYLTAWRGSELVGRCSAQIDREHLRVWKDDTGFFGFFDTINDDAVGVALIERAAKWLKARGMKRMMGPFSLYVNEEIGVLIEGFDDPPSLMMAHSRKWQGRVAEACGLEKEKDLLAWKYVTGDFPKRVLRAWESVKEMPEVRLRSINTNDMHNELKTVLEIYNDAWEGKWGFVPAMPEEAEKMAADLKLIIDADLAFMADVNGKTMGMCIMLPNMNEAIADLDGKLFPFGFAKLLWRMKVRHPISTRLMMLGIRKELRGVRQYMGLSAAMYVEVAKRGIAKGYKWGELSWTREDDSPINAGIMSMGANVYKKYRVYHKAL